MKRYREKPLIRGFSAQKGRSTPRLERRGKPFWVYVITDGISCKVGLADNVPVRLAALQTGNPRKLEISAAWQLPSYDHAYLIEQMTLRACLRHRSQGEWVNTTPDAITRFIGWLIHNISKAKVMRPCNMRDVRLEITLAAITKSSNTINVIRKMEFANGVA